MPELPEVEAARKFVEEHCLGQPIMRARVADDSKVLCEVSARTLEETLTGRTIVQAHRKGKHLWFELDRRPWPAFQFGMTGAILIKNVKGIQYKRSAANDEEEWPSRYSKVLVELENGVEMAFSDKRRFARVRLLQDPPAEPPISELGPDAYLDYPAEDAFVKAIQLRKGTIKGILLDQSFLAGIGNWIADEVLYQAPGAGFESLEVGAPSSKADKYVAARIHPEIQASRMTLEDSIRLYRSVKEVVQLSVAVNADHDKFPKDWLFHLRWNKKPGFLEGNKIDFITVGGRTSAYVPALQKCTQLARTTQLSTSDKRTSLEEVILSSAPEVSNGKIPRPRRMHGKFSFAKRRKSSSTCNEEEVMAEEGFEETTLAIATELTTDGNPMSSVCGKNSSRIRKKTHLSVEEVTLGSREAQSSPPTREEILKVGRKQRKANVALSSVKGERDLNGPANRRSSTRLQIRKENHDFGEEVVGTAKAKA